MLSTMSAFATPRCRQRRAVEMASVQPRRRLCAAFYGVSKRRHWLHSPCFVPSESG